MSHDHVEAGPELGRRPRRARCGRGRGSAGDVDRLGTIDASAFLTAPGGVVAGQAHPRLGGSARRGSQPDPAAVASDPDGDPRCGRDAPSRDDRRGGGEGDFRLHDRPAEDHPHASGDMPRILQARVAGPQREDGEAEGTDGISWMNPFATSRLSAWGRPEELDLVPSRSVSPVHGSAWRRRPGWPALGVSTTMSETAPPGPAMTFRGRRRVLRGEAATSTGTDILGIERPQGAVAGADEDGESSWASRPRSR